MRSKSATASFPACGEGHVLRRRPRFLSGAESPEAKICAINVLDVFHGEQRQGFEVWDAELTVFLREGQRRLLERAGFQSVEFYGAFDFAPYDEATSDRLIAVARR